MDGRESDHVFVVTRTVPQKVSRPETGSEVNKSAGSNFLLGWPEGTRARPSKRGIEATMCVDFVH